LSYVICESDEPDYEDEDEEDFNFEQLSIKCAPLVGVFYKTDARKVHQLIHGFVQGETSELGSSLKRKGRTVNSILKLFRLTTVAKGTSQSGSRRLRSLGTRSTTRMKGQCPSKSS
jgi:hypothetical protein